MPELSREEQAALLGFFAEARGKHALHPRLQALLVAEAVDQQRSASELPLFPSPGDDAEDIVEEWKEFAMDAKLVKLSDQGALRRWVIGKELAGASPDARAASVLDLLLERGVSVPAKVQAEVTATTTTLKCGVVAPGEAVHACRSLIADALG